MTIPQRLRWFFLESTPEAQRARGIAKLVITLCLFVGLFLFIPIADVFAALVDADFRPLITGLVFIFISVLLASIQLKIIAGTQGIELGIAKLLRINLAVKFYILVTPGTVVGSGVRWYRLSQPDGKGVEAFVALAFSRILETYLAIVFGLAFFLLSSQTFSWSGVAILAGLFATSVLLWYLLIRSSDVICAWIQRRFSHITDGSKWKKALYQLERLFTAISAFKGLSVWELFLVNSVVLSSKFFGVLSDLFLSRAVGINLTFLQMGWIYSAVILVTRLPFTIAGGLGIREASLVALLTAYGIQADLALAFSFLQFARSVLLGLTGGLGELDTALRARRSEV